MIQVLSLAFSNDPFLRRIFPSPQQYHAEFASFVRAFAGSAFAVDTAFYIVGFDGCSLWFPPGMAADNASMVEYLKPILPARKLETVNRLQRQMHRSQPEGPFWYLRLIGVDTCKQRNGLGTALMNQVMQTCDAKQFPAYLESTNSQHYAFYQRLGFQLIDTIALNDAPAIYPMIRNPKKLTGHRLLTLE